ncbi:MAG: hypothetical protein JWO89_768, partial [Verrucomicrobiaceae bacterium]|nr:hypothetical protein [Verrucomicrobiaceae bacterium]
MKRIVAVLAALCLAACQAPHQTPHPSQTWLTVGQPLAEPQGRSVIMIPGVKSGLVPVRLTNISSEPVWFVSFSPRWMPCNVFVRSAGTSQWKILTRVKSGPPNQFQKLDPGQSVSFKTWILGNPAGQELSVKVDLFKTASLAHPLSVTSAAV